MAIQEILVLEVDPYEDLDSQLLREYGYETQMEAGNSADLFLAEILEK